MSKVEFGVWAFGALLAVWVLVMVIWWRWGKRLARMDKDEEFRPYVSCNKCARQGNGCPIAPRDYAEPIKCCEYRPMGSKNRVAA